MIARYHIVLLALHFLRNFYKLNATSAPSMKPTCLVTTKPTSIPTALPSTRPSNIPTCLPSISPTNPTCTPTKLPSVIPSCSPSLNPSTLSPSMKPSIAPTVSPTTIPSMKPSLNPTCSPSINPTNPTCIPTLHPSTKPNCMPSINPTVIPTITPSSSPSMGPSTIPTCFPSIIPTYVPTVNPTNPTCIPTSNPSKNPSLIPTTKPSTTSPTKKPTSMPSIKPTTSPSMGPSTIPTCFPSIIPTYDPTVNPTNPTCIPSIIPSKKPSCIPSIKPSTITPSVKPTAKPTIKPTSSPTTKPSTVPTFSPSLKPTCVPTVNPTNPTCIPTTSPSRKPTLFNSNNVQYDNAQRYEAIDPLTFDVYTQHWRSYHSKWIGINPDIPFCDELRQIVSYPICIDEKLVRDSYYGDFSTIIGSDQVCPNAVCLSKTDSGSQSCSVSPFDTIDYLPPVSKTSLDSSYICNNSHISIQDWIDPNISSTSYTLDLGLPPLYIPIIPVRLHMYGKVLSIVNEQCVPIENAEIIAWQVDPTLLNLYNLNQQYHSAADSELNNPNHFAFSNSASAYQSSQSIPKTTLNKKPSLRDVSGRATQHTSSTGSYDFLTFMPPSYGPPRHIMFQISAPGYKTLTTRVYFDFDWRLQQLTTLNGQADDALDTDSLSILLGFPNDRTVSRNRLPGAISKDPRVAKLEFITTSTDSERGIVTGKFSTSYNFVLSPVRPISTEPTTHTLADGSEIIGIATATEDESFVPPLDIDGLWTDLDSGAQIKLETFGPSIVLAEYPHARTWGVAIGMVVGNTIRGVDFKQIRSIEEVENARRQVNNPEINFNPSSTVWVSSGLSNGNILTSDPYSTGPFTSSSSDTQQNTIVQQPEVLSIRWSSGDMDGYNNIWTRQIQDTVSGSTSFQSKELGYRFLKLLINRETGGFSGGKLVLNEIEFFEGILGQQQVPFFKMQTPRFPIPQRVSCSTFQDQATHCYKAFDGDVTSNSAWITKPVGSRRNVLVQPQWVTFDFGENHNVRPSAMRLFCDIHSADSKDPFVALGCPMTFTLFGSMDNIKFDLIYQDDLYDYKGDYGINGKIFYFIFETAKGRVNGQQCGSCTMGPDFACQLQAYDSSCDSRYCGANSLCSLEPICPPGEYMKYGFTGYSRPAFECKTCAAGRYSSSTNQVSQKLLAAQCDGLCSPGYYCLEGSTSPKQFPCGDVKYFCPEGSPKPILAGAGRYTVNNFNNQTTSGPQYRLAEILCDFGYYCKNGEKIMCPIGRYGNTVGLQTSLCNGECEAGAYCPLGTINSIICPIGHYCPDGRTKIICPAGTYGAGTGLNDILCSGLCSLGHYCPAGSISPISKECPIGRFGAINGLTNSSCSGICSAGYYCPSASISSKERPCGGSSVYCPQGSFLPTIVSPGYYTIGGDSIYTKVAQQLVEAGFYSIYGVKWPCRAGTYGVVNGLTIDDKYHLETLLPTNIPTPVPTTLPTLLAYTYKPTIGNTHAPVISNMPTMMPTATPSMSPSTCTPSLNPSFTLSMSPSEIPSLKPSTLPTTKPSPAPSFPSITPTTSPSFLTAPSYTPSLAPSGTSKPTRYAKQPTSSPTAAMFESDAPTFSPTVDKDLPLDSFFTCSGLCFPGYFCPKNSVSPQPCPAGRYGYTSGLIDSDCTDICPLGHYCPEASIEPIQCPSGVFGNSTGLIDSTCSANCWFGGCDFSQQLCFAGFYCPVGSIQGNQIPCGDAKYYCPKGSFLPTIVSPGYYTIGEPTIDGLITLTDPAFTRSSQLICEEGNFCMDGVKSKCPPGFYGVSKGLQTPFCTGPCPKGYYCPEGSFNGTTHRCPAGRYGDITGLYDSSCSGYCSPGYHCYEASTSPTQLECAVLYISGNIYNNIGILQKDFIISGNISIDESLARTNVYLNDFNTTFSYLPNTNRTIQVLSNPNSVYCPLGTSIPLTVRPGYYTVGYNKTTRYTQISCPLGSYCKDGVINDCPPGRYGRAERLTSELCTGSCAKGHYCPAGSISSTEYPCPIGRYGSSEGLSDSYCSGACSHALDCPIGSVSPRPRNEF